MSKSKKKQLMASAPWRVEEDGDEDFKDAKLKVTSQPGGTSTMHVPRKKSVRSRDQDPDDSLTEIDPELRYSFQRNFQVLSLLYRNTHFVILLIFLYIEFILCMAMVLEYPLGHFPYFVAQQVLEFEG